MRLPISNSFKDLFAERTKSLADVVLRLKSLREDSNLQDLMDVHGIIDLKKFANLTSLKPLLGQDGTTTYGFKATKRKFKIEVGLQQLDARVHYAKLVLKT